MSLEEQLLVLIASYLKASVLFLKSKYFLEQVVNYFVCFQYILTWDQGSMLVQYSPALGLWEHFRIRLPI